MFGGIENIFSPFSPISPYSFRWPFSEELELGSILKTDIHSHLIPGVDDGAKNISESINMIKKLHSLGFKKIITTPHMMQDKYGNSHQKIKEGVSIVKRELAENSINIQFEAASEYYVDEEFKDFLYNKELLTFGDNYVLFEISSNYQKEKLVDLVLEIQVSGYIPVLAHPERYYFMHNNREMYEELKKNGVLFQVDMLSFTSYHSFNVQKIALWLCNSGMIDFIGSDAHKIKHLKIIEKLKSTRILKILYGKNNLLNNTL